MDLIYGIFDTLYKAISAAKVADKDAFIFLGNRPQTMQESPQCIVVIDLPTEIEHTIKGNDEEEMQNYTTGLIYIYCKSKTNGTLNPKVLTTKVDTVRKLFPIKSDVCSCVNPRRMLSGNDGYGYHIASIAFRIRTNPINQQ